MSDTHSFNVFVCPYLYGLRGCPFRSMSDASSTSSCIGSVCFCGAQAGSNQCRS
jgi:hypothetical protein